MGLSGGLLSYNLGEGGVKVRQVGLAVFSFEVQAFECAVPIQLPP